MSFSLIYALTFTNTTATNTTFFPSFSKPKRDGCAKKKVTQGKSSHITFFSGYSKLKKKKLARVAVYVHVGKRKKKVNERKEK